VSTARYERHVVGARADFPDGTHLKTCDNPKGHGYVGVARMLPAMVGWIQSGRSPQQFDVGKGKSATPPPPFPTIVGVWSHDERNVLIRGKWHTMILDHGRIVKSSATQLTLREPDGTMATIPLAPKTKVAPIRFAQTPPAFRRGLWAIPVICVFFAAMGALENMQEEIIPLVPVLLVLGQGLGVDAVAVVAMSAGAAMIGSAFGPTNPFQAGIALKLAQLSPVAGGRLRLAMFVTALLVWIAWTVRHAARHRAAPVQATATASAHLAARHVLILVTALAPMAAYVYGALRLDWGFNELSGAFLIGGVAAGLLGGMTLTATITTFLEGAASIVGAAILIGAARSISLVLEDGRIVDTILHALEQPLERVPAVAAALLQIPAHALIHLAVPSVSGQAVLTMPLFVPLADLLGLSRQVPVLAYQTGAGLAELIWPTNGALMAVLLAAGVPYQQWVRFVVGGVGLAVLIGVVSIAAVLWFAAGG